MSVPGFLFPWSKLDKVFKPMCQDVNPIPADSASNLFCKSQIISVF